MAATACAVLVYLWAEKAARDVLLEWSGLVSVGLGVLAWAATFFPFKFAAESLAMLRDIAMNTERTNALVSRLGSTDVEAAAALDRMAR